MQRYFKIDVDGLGYIINAYWIELYLNSYFYFSSCLSPIRYSYSVFVNVCIYLFNKNQGRDSNISSRGFEKSASLPSMTLGLVLSILEGE